MSHDIKTFCVRLFVRYLFILWLPLLFCYSVTFLNYVYILSYYNHTTHLIYVVLHQRHQVS